MTTYQYNGPGDRTYPGILHPQTGAVLQGLHALDGGPGVPVDFGDQLPPDDGYWYAVPSGQPASDSPSGTGAEQDKEE